MSDKELHKKISEMRKNPHSIERNGDYWSKDDMQTLSDLFYMGCGISEIALDMKRSERTVMTKTQELGLYPSRYAKQVKKPSCKCRECDYFEKPDKCHKPGKSDNV